MIKRLPFELQRMPVIQDKVNEIIDAVNEIMTWRFETDEPDPELSEKYGHDLAEAIEDCGDLFKKGPVEPVTLTDIFNEMGRLYADLWNKMEDIHHDLKTKGGYNE